MLNDNFSQESVFLNPCDWANVHFDTLEPRLFLSASPVGDGAEAINPVGAADCVVEGRVWRDQDQDGVFDSEDYGIPFTPVEILGDSFGAVVLTDADGFYSAADVPSGVSLDITAPEFYEMYVQPASGNYTTVLTPGQTFSGADFSVDWETLNLSYRVDIITPNDPEPLEDMCVYADMNGNFQFDDGEFYAVTDSDGNCNIDQLWHGDFMVSLDLPDDRIVIGGPAFRQAAGASVFAVADMGALQGSAWLDCEGQGWHEDAEAYIGRPVYVDINHNGIFDSCQLGTSLAMFTSSCYSFSLSDALGVSNFKIELDFNIDNTSDYDAGVTLKLISPRGVSVVLADGLTAGAQSTSNFGMYFSDKALVDDMTMAFEWEAVRPLESFDAFADMPAVGTWYLKVECEDPFVNVNMNHSSIGVELSESGTVTDMDGNFEMILPQFGTKRLRSLDGQNYLDVQLPQDESAEDILLAVVHEHVNIEGRVRGYQDDSSALMTKYNGWLVELVDTVTGDVIDSTYTDYYDADGNGTVDAGEHGYYCFEEVCDLEYDLRFTTPSESWAIADMPERILNSRGADARFWDYQTMGDTTLNPQFIYHGWDNGQLFETFVYDKSIYVMTSHDLIYDGLDVIRLWRFDNIDGTQNYDAVWTVEVDTFADGAVPDLQAYYSLALAGSSVFVGRQLGDIQSMQGYEISAYDMYCGESTGSLNTDCTETIAGSVANGVLYVVNDGGEYDFDPLDNTVIKPRRVCVYDSETLELLRIAPVPLSLNSMIYSPVAGVIDGKLAFETESGFVFVDMENYLSGSIVYDDRPISETGLDSVVYSTRELQTQDNGEVIELNLACPVVYFAGQTITFGPDGESGVPVNNLMVYAGDIAAISAPVDIDQDGQIDLLDETACYEIKIIIKGNEGPDNVELYADDGNNNMNFTLIEGMEVIRDVSVGNQIIYGAYGLPQLAEAADHGLGDDGITAIRTYDPVSPVALFIDGAPDGIPARAIVNGRDFNTPYSEVYGLVLPGGIFREGENINDIYVEVNGRPVGKLMLQVDILTGDFDYDGEIARPSDIDLISEVIRDGGYVGRMDLNLDGVLDQADRSMLIEHQALGNTHIGDIDMDGQVTIMDFLQLKSNYGSVSGYAGGDLNGDGVVDILDFLILKSNYGK